MKVCPHCSHRNHDRALRCSNSECEKPFDLPQIDVSSDPVADLQSALQQRDREIADAREQIAKLEQNGSVQQAALQQRVEALAADNARLRAAPNSSAQPSGAWGAAALLGAVRKWPRLATVVTGLMALGTTYGGWQLTDRMFGAGTDAVQVRQETPVADKPAVDNPVVETPVGGPSNAEFEALTKERDALVQKLKDETAKFSVVAKERDDAKTLVPRLQSERDAKTKEAEAAQLALKEAQGKAKVVASPAPKPIPSSGFVDLVVPARLRDHDSIVLENGKVPVLPGGSWPSGPCSLIAGDPEAVFTGATAATVSGRRRTLVLPNECSNSRIVVTKAERWDTGDIVRLFWQSK